MPHEVYMAIPFVAVLLIGFAGSRLANDWAAIAVVVLTPIIAINLDLKFIADSFWVMDGHKEFEFGLFIYAFFTIAGMGFGWAFWSITGFFAKQR